MKRLMMVILTACLILQIPGSSSAATEMIDSWLGPEFRISQSTPSNEPERYDPAVAYNWNQHEYLVVWLNSRGYSFSELYAQRVSPSGQLLGSFDLTSDVGVDGHSRRDPAIAYNASEGEYLLVYVYEEVDELLYDIRGRRIAWNGAWLGTEVEIFSHANRGFFKPRVDWNPYRDQYLVVADAYDTSTHKYNDVAGRRMKGDLSTLYTGHSISLQDQNLQPQASDVVYNIAMDEYLVVWRQNLSGDNWDIWGARVRGSDDAVVSSFSIDTSNKDQNYPAVATNTQNRYLVVWEQGWNIPTTDWEIYGRELDITGGTVVGPFVIANTGDDETYPDVAINGANNRRMVVWRRYYNSGYAIWQRGWFPTDLIMPTSFEVAPPSGVWALPAIVASPRNTLSVYEKRVTKSYIYGRLYWENQIFLPVVKKN